MRRRVDRWPLLLMATILVVPLACAPPASTGQAAIARAAVASPQEEDAVRQAAFDYIDGFYTGDSTLHLRSISPLVRKYGYASRDGAYRGMAMEFPAGFMNFARGVRAGSIKTPAGAPREVIIHEVLDQTASAKVVAWWGIDYLHLAKENGRWMIVNVLWQSPPPGA